MKKDIRNGNRWVRLGMYLAIGLTMASAIWYLYRGLSLIL